MTPGQQQRKDAQDEARREQQADERIRELEVALLEVMDYIEGRQDGPMSSNIDPDEIWGIANRALDGVVDEDQQRVSAKMRSLEERGLAECRAQVPESALDGGGDADE